MALDSRLWASGASPFLPRQLAFRPAGREPPIAAATERSEPSMNRKTPSKGIQVQTLSRRCKRPRKQRLRDIEKVRLSRVARRVLPSTMLLGIEADARLSWGRSPNHSSRGKFRVSL